MSIGKSVIHLQIGKRLVLTYSWGGECAKDQWLDFGAWKVLLVAFGDSRASSVTVSLLAHRPGEGWNETVPVYVALWSQYMYNVAFHIPQVFS